MPIEILGCRLDVLDAAAATERIVELAQAGNSAQVVTLGTEMVVYAQRDPAFRAIVNACTLSLCDTVGVLLVARRSGAALRERVTGVDLIDRVCRRAAHENLSVYLLGGAEGVAADAAAVLEVRFPGLTVAGARSGYFATEESLEIAQEIAASGARILLVGLGSPRQERWLAAYLRVAGCGVGIGVGGSFDVIGGRVERAPEAWQSVGLEWLYRLFKEPGRWRRQLALPYFIWLVVLERLGCYSTKGATNS